MIYLPHSVRYPITMPDFLMADVTDAMLDGYISGFPNTYALKVGKACAASSIRFHDFLLFPCVVR